MKPLKSFSAFCGILLFLMALQIGLAESTFAVVWTDEVISSNQEFLKNGSPITDPARIDPASTLGPKDFTFFSLGFGGEVVLKFPGFAAGTLTVYEATGGTYPLETAKVLVSSDGIDWSSLGEANNTVGNFQKSSSLSLPEEECVQYVKIMDTTDAALHTSTADAFDVIAVSAEEVTTECAVCESIEQVIPLIAGQDEQAGGITMVNDDENLYVTFSTDGDWVLAQTHLEVATSEEDIPQNKKGSPKIGHFTYSQTHDPGITEMMYTIPLDEVEVDQDGNLVIAAHAVVQRVEGEEIVQEETGWGQGTRFVEKGTWAMYFKYILQCTE